jgi:hypothetical protein
MDNLHICNIIFIYQSHKATDLMNENLVQLCWMTLLQGRDIICEFDTNVTSFLLLKLSVLYCFEYEAKLFRKFFVGRKSRLYYLPWE